MALIDYDTWMKDTARFGLKRSDELVAVDEAFLAYEKLGTGVARQTLQAAFSAWKTKVGAGEAWRRSSRNHRRAADKLDTLLAGGVDDDTAFHRGQVPDFMHEDLVNARLGVLYLFSRLSVTPGLFKMTLNGGLSIAQNAMKVGGSSKQEIKDFKSYSGKASMVAGPLGGALENKITDKLFKKRAAQNMSLPAGAMPSVPAQAGATLVTSEQIKQEAEQAAMLASRPALRKVADKIQEWFDMLVEKVVTMLEERFGTIAGIAATVKSLVLALVGIVAKEAAPFVKQGLDLARSVGQTIKAAITRFKTWADGRKVEIALGHPSTVVDSITRAMTVSLFQGLWGVLKGAGGIAMQATSFGSAAIVNMVIAASELLFKFIWKLGETIHFNRFCNEARGYWENQGEGGLHRHPFAFSEWYRAAALNHPLIATLTLCTGICGDKMRYLAMYSGGRQISSAEFQAGVQHLDNLKAWGSDYIAGSGFRIRAAGDVLVEKLVSGFATSHGKPKNGFDLVMDAITA